MIPFMQVPAQMGLIGMWGLSKLFFLGCFIHGFRKWRLMLNLARERNSMYEGPPAVFLHVASQGNLLENTDTLRASVPDHPLLGSTEPFHP
jgi:hypothetical protein